MRRLAQSCVTHFLKGANSFITRDRLWSPRFAYAGDPSDPKDEVSSGNVEYTRKRPGSRRAIETWPMQPDALQTTLYETFIRKAVAGRGTRIRYTYINQQLK